MALFEVHLNPPTKSISLKGKHVLMDIDGNKELIVLNSG